MSKHAEGPNGPGGGRRDQARFTCHSRAGLCVILLGTWNFRIEIPSAPAGVSRATPLPSVREHLLQERLARAAEAACCFVVKNTPFCV